MCKNIYSRRMIMKKWRFLALTLLITTCITGYALAYSSNLDDKPAVLEQGNRIGYFLWQDENGLHLRTTSTGIKHVFNGTIRTDGRFDTILAKYKGNMEDFFNVNTTQNKITYQFVTLDEEEGLDFQLTYGSYMKFIFTLDGEAIDSEKIFIGKEGWHPARNEFTLRHDEDYIKYMNERTVYFIRSGFWRPGWHGHGPQSN